MYAYNMCGSLFATCKFHRVSLVIQQEIIDRRPMGHWLCSRNKFCWWFFYFFCCCFRCFLRSISNVCVCWFKHYFYYCMAEIKAVMGDRRAIVRGRLYGLNCIWPRFYQFWGRRVKKKQDPPLVSVPQNKPKDRKMFSLFSSERSS